MASSLKWPKGKLFFLIAILVVYTLFGISVKMAADAGIIKKASAAPEEVVSYDIAAEAKSKDPIQNLQAAELFLNNKLLKENKHIYLEFVAYNNGTETFDYNTNSEALSYYLLWNSIEKNKEGFDSALEFVDQHMIHRNHNYMMWRLDNNDTAADDGSNLASDADLRTLKALFIAEEQWKDKRYTKLIEKLSGALEKAALTQDGMLAPYAGSSGENSTWTAQEVWLSYSDFTVFDKLSQRKGKPWISIKNRMKDAVLKAQLYNGLYNSMLTEKREYGNGIDAGGYGINSMWIMVRNAESSDQELKESAKKSLNFYKQKFSQDGELYSLYSSSGDALSPADTPWVYALVGRAAISLQDNDFADKIINKLLEKQVTDEKSILYGSFPEPVLNGIKAGQFTLQESILTLQQYVKSKNLTPVK